MPRKIKDWKAHFKSRLETGTADECWEWQGFRMKNGYGRMGRGGKFLLAHRVAWEIEHGTLPLPGLLVCHKCDNPPCCNPAHLFLGTFADNARDMVQKDRHTRGDRNANSKMEDRQAQAIYDAKGVEPRATTAKRFGVSIATVTDIHLGRRWAWLTGHEFRPGKMGTQKRRTPPALVRDLEACGESLPSVTSISLGEKYGFSEATIRRRFLELKTTGGIS